MSPNGAYGKAHVRATPRTLGERLKKIRILWDWSQTEMAEALGTNQRTYSAWERDIQLPSQASMMALSRFLRLPSIALVKGQGFSVPEPPVRFEEASNAAELPGTLALLPHPASGAAATLLRIDAPGEPSEALRPKEAVEALRAALKEGGPIWIVVGPR